MSNIYKNRQEYQSHYSEKGALELHSAATIEPRQKEHSFLLLEYTEQIQVNSLLDAWLQKSHNSPMEDDNCPPPQKNNYLG